MLAAGEGHTVLLRSDVTAGAQQLEQQASELREEPLQWAADHAAVAEVLQPKQQISKVLAESVWFRPCWR